MGFLDKLFGNDHERAATRYADRESASAAASRKRREAHHRKGIRKAETAARQWEAAERRRLGG